MTFSFRSRDNGEESTAVYEWNDDISRYVPVRRVALPPENVIALDSTRPLLDKYGNTPLHSAVSVASKKRLPREGWLRNVSAPGPAIPSPASSALNVGDFAEKWLAGWTARCSALLKGWQLSSKLSVASLLCQLLVRAGDGVSAVKQSTGMTPLHWAAFHGGK